LAAGQNPGERERRRWAARLLDGKRYHRGVPAGEVHLDLRASTKITMRNLASSTEIWQDHVDCDECTEILDAHSRDEPLMTDVQWRMFSLFRRS
jgi:hypothetical protein